METSYRPLLVLVPLVMFVAIILGGIMLSGGEPARPVPVTTTLPDKGR